MGLCPHLRLLQVCTRMLNDNALDNVDALLGWTIFLYSLSFLLFILFILFFFKDLIISFSSDILMGLCPHLRLLQVCTRMLNDNALDNVDALLGCPVLLYPQSMIEEFVLLKDKDPVCLSVFQTINWYAFWK